MGRVAFALAACLLAGSAPTEATSRINDARKLYNQQLYELAIKAATEARAGRRCRRRGQPDRRPRPSRAFPTDPRRTQPHRGAGGAAGHRRLAVAGRGAGRVHAGPGPVAVSGRQVPRGRRVVRLDLGQGRQPGPCGARSRARLVGDRHRPAGAGRSRASRRAVRAHHRSHGGGASAAARFDRGRLLACRRGAIRVATPIAPGTRRWRGTCARGSRPTAAPHCAPTSIGWSPRRSFPSVRVRSPSPTGDVKPAIDAMTTEWEQMKALWN